MKKRFLSILMCVAMVLTLLPTTVLAADPTDHWTDEGNVGTLPDSVDNVYTITSAAELAAIAKAVNEQTNDFSGKTILLAGDNQNINGVSCPFPGDGAPFLHFAGKGRSFVLRL